MLLGTYLPADLTVVLRGRGASRAMEHRLNADIARVDPTLALFQSALTRCPQG